MDGKVCAVFFIFLCEYFRKVHLRIKHDIQFLLITTYKYSCVCKSTVGGLPKLKVKFKGATTVLQNTQPYRKILK